MFRTTMIMAGLLAAALSLFSCGTNKAPAEDASQSVAAEIAGVAKVSLGVDGMTCSGCEFNVESAIEKVAGVSHVEADYEKGVAVVDFDPEKTNADQFIEAVNRVGYKAHKPKLN